MKKYLFEEIPLAVPSGRAEMKSVFSKMLDDSGQSVISFINPEIFLAQEKNPLLHEYFRSVKYNFIDGINLLYAINKKLGTSYSAADRYPGTDFFDYLPDDAKLRIESAHPNVKIIEWTFGYTKFDGDYLIEKINAAKPDILIVCKGCPLQKQWIWENRQKLNAKIIFGNGGAVDFWSGNTKRAPEFMIRLGLEWLFRLFASFSFKRLARQMKLVKFLVKYKRGEYDVREEV